MSSYFVCLSHRGCKGRVNGAFVARPHRTFQCDAQNESADSEADEENMARATAITHIYLSCGFPPPVAQHKTCLFLGNKGECNSWRLRGRSRRNCHACFDTEVSCQFVWQSKRKYIWPAENRKFERNSIILDNFEKLRWEYCVARVESFIDACIICGCLLFSRPFPQVEWNLCKKEAQNDRSSRCHVFKKKKKKKKNHLQACLFFVRGKHLGQGKEEFPLCNHWNWTMVSLPVDLGATAQNLWWVMGTRAGSGKRWLLLVSSWHVRIPEVCQVQKLKR